MTEQLLIQATELLRRLEQANREAQSKQDSELLTRIIRVSNKANKRYWRRRAGAVGGMKIRS